MSLVHLPVEFTRNMDVSTMYPALTQCDRGSLAAHPHGVAHTIIAGRSPRNIRITTLQMISIAPFFFITEANRTINLILYTCNVIYTKIYCTIMSIIKQHKHTI